MNRHAKILFGIAALFNWAVGLSWLFAWPLMQELMQLAPAEGSNRMLINICAVLVITFGYAYFMVGRDPVTYRPYAILGTIGKLLVVAVIAPVLFSLSQGWILALLAMGDLLFALLFIHFLRTYPAGLANLNHLKGQTRRYT